MNDYNYQNEFKTKLKMHKPSPGLDRSPAHFFPAKVKQVCTFARRILAMFSLATTYCCFPSDMIKQLSKQIRSLVKNNKNLLLQMATKTIPDAPTMTKWTFLFKFGSFCNFPKTYDFRG